MSWKDKVVGAFFILAVIGSLATIVYIVVDERGQRAAAGADVGGRDDRLVRGIALDFGRAVQDDDPESACFVLAEDAFEAFDCRFGRQEVPAGLGLTEDAPLTAGEVVVQGDQALIELRGGAAPLPVRLERIGRRWRIVRVGLPKPARE